jgi:predicted pyridoxine 5'-phosphate oxidase superfamily flavin-nucleotide-binding protein
MPPLPWHDGERALQADAGVLAKMEEWGPRVIRDYMPDQHREFFSQLPFVVLGTVAPDGRVWATLRAGYPGFLDSPEPRRLNLALEREAADPADAGLDNGNAIGLLGIDLATRRRNRMNGVLRHAKGRISHVDVMQSFGNCPRYIHPRVVAFTRDPSRPSGIAPQRLDVLDGPARDLIGKAATLFVASYVDLPGQGRQVDVSHRGGDAGFVRIDTNGALTIPDFNGNRFFNTLGNFVVNPVAGVTFVEFDTGGLLQMSGRTELIVDSPEIATFPGAERLWRFFPEIIVRREQALALRWSLGDASPMASLHAGNGGIRTASARHQAGTSPAVAIRAS